MGSHRRKLWAGGILLALGGTAAAAVSADSPTATETASGTVPVEVRTEVVRKTIHRKARATRRSDDQRGSSDGRGSGGDHTARAAAVALPAPASPAPAPAPIVSRSGESDHQSGRGSGRSGGEDERGDDHGAEQEREHEAADDHSGGDE